MQEILKLLSIFPGVRYQIPVIFAPVNCACADIAGNTAVKFKVTATVGIANFIGVSKIFIGASASVASLNLDHHLIDLVELRYGGVERLRSLVICGDTRDVSAYSI